MCMLALPRNCDSLTINMKVVLSALLSAGIDSHTRVSACVADLCTAQRQHSATRQHLGRRQSQIRDQTEQTQAQTWFVHQGYGSQSVNSNLSSFIQLICQHLYSMRDARHGAAIFEPCEAGQRDAGGLTLQPGSFIHHHCYCTTSAGDDWRHCETQEEVITAFKYKVYLDCVSFFITRKDKDGFKYNTTL